MLILDTHLETPRISRASAYNYCLSSGKYWVILIEQIGGLAVFASDMEVDEPSDWQEAAPAAVNQTAPAPPEYEIVHGFKFVKDPNSSVGSSPSKSTPNETAPEQQSSTTVKTANKPKKPSKPKGTSKNKLQKADAAKMNGTSAELDAAARKVGKSHTRTV